MVWTVADRIERVDGTLEVLFRTTEAGEDVRAVGVPLSIDSVDAELIDWHIAKEIERATAREAMDAMLVASGQGGP